MVELCYSTEMWPNNVIAHYAKYHKSTEDSQIHSTWVAR